MIKVLKCHRIKAMELKKINKHRPYEILIIFVCHFAKDFETFEHLNVWTFHLNRFTRTVELNNKNFINLKAVRIKYSTDPSDFDFFFHYQIAISIELWGEIIRMTNQWKQILNAIFSGFPWIWIQISTFSKKANPAL